MKTKSIIELDNSELESLKQYAIENNLSTRRQALVNIAIRLANKQLAKCNTCKSKKNEATLNQHP